MALAVAGSGVPAEEWRSEISELLFALGWRSGRDRFSPPPANSATLDVLDQLAGAARTRWSEIKGVDLAVAATARAVIRRMTPDLSELGAPRNRLTLSRKPRATSPSPALPAIPPVAGRFVPDDSRGELNVTHVAELPEFLRRSRVLKDHLVDFERVDLTRLKAFDRWLDATDELAELLLVIGSDGLASGPTIGLGGHSPRLDGPRSPPHPATGTAWSRLPAPTGGEMPVLR